MYVVMCVVRKQARMHAHNMRTTDTHNTHKQNTHRAIHTGLSRGVQGPHQKEGLANASVRAGAAGATTVSR